MLKGATLLPETRVKCTPLTARKGVVRKKIQLVKAIKNEIGDQDIEKVRENCRDKRLYLEVRFRLLETNQTGSSQKDLDNLLKLLCDILPDRIVAKGTDSKDTGLGLIREHDDHQIFGILCSKKIVKNESQVGIDLAIYEWHGD